MAFSKSSGVPSRQAMASKWQIRTPHILYHHPLSDKRQYTSSMGISMNSIPQRRLAKQVITLLATSHGVRTSTTPIRFPSYLALGGESLVMIYQLSHHIGIVP